MLVIICRPDREAMDVLVCTPQEFEEMKKRPFVKTALQEGTILEAVVLDKYYIPICYPNGLPGGMPYEAYDEDDAKKATGMAEMVMEYIGSAIEEIQG